MLRTIKPEEFSSINGALVIDIRREEDYQKSSDKVPGSEWKDPTRIDEWIDSISKNEQVIIYCVRGGGVSNSVVDKLHAEGVNAQFIEGGIEGLKAAGVEIAQKQS